MDADQLGLADPGIALILAIGGAAVTQEVLHRGDHMAAIEEAGRTDLALQAFHHRTGIAGHHVRGFGIAFVGAAPAIVLRHRHGGRERPLHAGCTGFQRGDFSDPAQQLRVAGRAQADVVREQGGADDVALSVHGINAEHDWNCLAALRGIHGGLVERIGQCQPFGGRGVVAATGIGVAAGQDRTQPISAHVFRRDAGDIALHQLPDFFLHRHRRHQIGDAPFQGGILGQRPCNLWPRVGFGLGGRCGGVLALACNQGQHQRGYQHCGTARGIVVRHGAHPSICSSSLPLVSCTYLSTKKTEMTAATR
ncbi:hypothetical protein D3C71_1406070 [compost metagenome]